MSDNLKKDTVRGITWSAIDKVANGGIQFLTNILLARLLLPKDFGLLAMIAIFIQISQTFIDSGFSNALIQKKDRSQVDYSTVFFFNLGVSLLFYVVLFFSAPLIADFFKSEQLTSLTRVVGLNLVIGALVAVHRTRLTVELRFKIQSIIALVASVVSAGVSVVMALKGFGVWSLVALTLINTAIQVIMINILIKWHPSLIFSKQSFRRLFSFSSHLLGAQLIHLLYRNLYPIFIGKKFSSVQLGYFNRADLFAMYPSSTISSVVARVAYPVFSRMQDDDVRLKAAYSKYIAFSSLLIFPLMTGLMILAQPVTQVVLTDKWLPMVPMLQILCIDWMTDHLCQINLNVLFVKGRSDLAFRLEIVKKGIAIVILLVSLYWGIIGVCWGRVVYAMFAVVLNSYYTKHLIDLSLWKQFRILLWPAVYTLIMAAVVMLVCMVAESGIAKIVWGTLSGMVVYLIVLRLAPDSPLLEIKNILKK